MAALRTANLYDLDFLFSTPGFRSPKNQAGFFQES